MMHGKAIWKPGISEALEATVSRGIAPWTPQSAEVLV